jgi:hypothetical protein
MDDEEEVHEDGAGMAPATVSGVVGRLLKETLKLRYLRT